MLPHGVYFYQDFTISVWIKPLSFQNWANILLISNSYSKTQRYDVVALTYNTINKEARPHFVISDEKGNWSHITSSQSLRINEWSFVTAVLKGNTGYIYINGKQTAVGSLNRPRNVVRIKNNIGRDDVFHQMVFVI